MRRIAVLTMAAIFLGSCSSVAPKTANSNELRAPTSVSYRISRTFDPCRDSRDCQAGLACRKGWCVDEASRLGEAWDNCYQDPDCRSGVCEHGFCKPNSLVPANNGDQCLGARSNCRSGKCPDFKCQGSATFGAFANQQCYVGTDCLSGNCRNGSCAPGSDRLSCVWVDESANVQTECCSQHLVAGKCRGSSVGKCGVNIDCTEYVGKVCGAPGQHAQFANECCSGRLSGNVCAQDYSSPTQYCLKDGDCLSGKVCNSRSKTCVNQ